MSERHENTTQEPLVWWLSCADCEAIDRPRDGWPDYLRREFLSRYGRAGRGRLWVAERFGEVSVSWPEADTSLSKLLEERGGIVVDRDVAALLAGLPGIMTDLRLERWEPARKAAPAQQHEVTVYDRVAATARVSLAQFDAYLRRTGWVLDWIEEPPGMAHDLAHWSRGGVKLQTRRDEFFGEDIENLADIDGRRPSEVLADVAKEQV